MIFISLSKNSIKLLQVSNNLFGKPSVKKLTRLALNEGENWQNKLSPLINKQSVYLAIPDDGIFFHRIKAERTATNLNFNQEILRKAFELVPFQKEELYYKIIPFSSFSLFIGLTRKKIEELNNLFQKNKANLILLTSESFALFPLIKGFITPQKSLLYIDLGEKVAMFSFFDSEGPIFSFAQSISLPNLTSEIKQTIEYVNKNYETEVTRILLGGGGSINFPIATLNREIKFEIFKIGSKLPANFSLKVKEPAAFSLFAPVFGLFMESKEKNSLNLFNKEQIMSFEKQIKEKKTVPATSEATLQKSSASGHFPFLKLLLSFFILAVIASVTYYLILPKISKMNKEVKNIKVTPTKILTPSVTPTPTLAKKELLIQVLNGTGEENGAAVAAQILEDHGYTGLIETGNADKYGYQKTIVHTKEEKKDYLNDLLTVLTNEYPQSTGSADLETDNPYDIVIITGVGK